jgi:hypothetical protein
MAAMSDYLENKLIDQIFRGQAFAFPSTLYVGLYTATPADAAGGTEVSGNNYARASVAASLANFAGTQGAGSTSASSGATGTTSNNNSITFPTPSGTWGTVVAFGIFDAANGGNLLFWGALSISKTINQGDTVTFPASSLSLQIDN